LQVTAKQLGFGETKLVM